MVVGSKVIHTDAGGVCRHEGWDGRVHSLIPVQLRAGGGQLVQGGHVDWGRGSGG